MQKFFKPPVTLSTIAQYLAEEQVDLDSQGDSPIPGGFLWITDPATDELASAVSFRRYVPPDLEQPEQVWDEHSAPVLFVPWTGTVAETLDRMRQTGTEAAAVVNEYGETIGTLTMDDILETLFAITSSRSRRLLNRSSITHIADNTWHVTGITSLRRLAKQFKVTLPAHDSTSVAGLLHELMQRLPEPGDQVIWGPFHFLVLNMPEERVMIVELRLRQ